MMRDAIKIFLLTAVLLLFLVACGGEEPPVAEVETPTEAAAEVVVVEEATAVPTEAADLPEITAVTLDKEQLGNYESLEMVVELAAEFTNPFDTREVTLDGVFIGPDGTEMRVPGFWDAKEAWRVRFTPSQVGDWRYQLAVSDANGSSEAFEGTFNVSESGLHGWILPGNSVNPEYSGHYLVHHDGTPFYGIGHADALNILIDGFSVEGGVGLFNSMLDAGENYVVWWPLYNSTFISGTYDDYSPGNLAVIDSVVKDAQDKGIYLVMTVWDHPQLRDDTHDWGTGNWLNNGFNKLSSIDEFFTEEEPWAWQENLYRYFIARWGYSPAIGMWQTVSEINGTNSYDQTDPWHNKVNAYFIANDPYRHPTTASRSGDVDWEEGHLNMDAPQVHLYEFDDAVGAAEVLADWTSLMWDRAEKPNWVGEFGVPGNSEYPELFHNSIWAALANGAAMTPAEWNSGGNWMRMSPEMLEDLNRLGQFVSDMPLAALNPSVLEIGSSDAEVRAWGVAGNDGGLIWAQDFALDGMPIEDVRADETVRSGVALTVTGLTEGVYEIRPYDTWQGVYLDSFEVECAAGSDCVIALPDFSADIALKIGRNE